MLVVGERAVAVAAQHREVSDAPDLERVVELHQRPRQRRAGHVEVAGPRPRARHGTAPERQVLEVGADPVRIGRDVVDEVEHRHGRVERDGRAAAGAGGAGRRHSRGRRRSPVGAPSAARNTSTRSRNRAGRWSRHRVAPASYAAIVASSIGASSRVDAHARAARPSCSARSVGVSAGAVRLRPMADTESMTARRRTVARRARGAARHARSPSSSAEAGRLRDAAHGTRITFSPKVFIPLTMLCRDRCGYCTFAKPPARLDAPVPVARRGARDRPRAAPRSAATRRCSPSARRPRTRYPDAARVARRARVRVDRRLPRRRVRGWCSTRPACSPTPTPARSPQRRARAAAGGQPVAGDDDRDARRPPRRARRPARRRTRQDRRRAASPRSRPRAGPGSRSPPGSSSGIGETRAERHRRAASRSRDAHARHGHVQEVIVQNFLPKPGTAMHRARAVPDPTSSSGRSPSPGSCSARRCTSRRRRTSPSRRARRAARGRHRRLGRRLAGHARPREPRAAVARARRAARARPRPRARRSRRASPSTPSTCATPSAWLDPDVRFAGARARPTSKASPATTTGRPAATTPPPDAAPAAVPPVDGACRGAGRRGARRRASPARRSASTRSSRCSARAAPRSPRSPRSPTSCAARSSATPSRSCATATSTTRTSARSSAGSARSRRARSRSTCAARRTCSTLEEIQRRVVEAVECGATEVCLQGGIHPDFDGDYYLSTSPAR